MIICGYAGIGKSYLAKNFPGVIDLESTPFEKDWNRYAKCAVHYHKQGYLVLVSCHKEIREKFYNRDSEFCLPYGDVITVTPDKDDKEIYRKRYIERGNTPEFVEIQMNNWEKWLNYDVNKINLCEQWIVMKKGETLHQTIIRLAKKEPSFFCNYDNCPTNDCKQMKGSCVNLLREYANYDNLKIN